MFPMKHDSIPETTHEAFSKEFETPPMDQPFPRYERENSDMSWSSWIEDEPWFESNHKDKGLKKIVFESMMDALHHENPEVANKYVKHMKERGWPECHMFKGSEHTLPSAQSEDYSRTWWKDKFGSSAKERKIKHDLDKIPFETMQKTEKAAHELVSHLYGKFFYVPGHDVNVNIYRNIALRMIESQGNANKLDLAQGFEEIKQSHEYMHQKTTKLGYDMNSGFSRMEDTTRGQFNSLEKNAKRNETKNAQHREESKNMLNSIASKSDQIEQKLTGAYKDLKEKSKTMTDFLLDMREKKISKEQFAMIKSTISMASDGITTALHMCGEHKLANKVGTAFNAGNKLVESAMMLAGGFSFGGVVGVISAGITIASLFMDDGKDEAANQMMEALQAIHEEILNTRRILLERIDQMHKDLVKRLDRVEEKIDNSTHILLGVLDRLNKNQWNFNVCNSYSMKKLQSDLKNMEDVLNGKLDSVMFQKFKVASDEIDLYLSKKMNQEQEEEEEEEEMNLKKWIKICERLERGIRGISPSNDCVNGSLCKDYSLLTAGKVLSNQLEHTLGYLMRYLKELGLSNELDLLPSEIPNPIVYTSGLSRYLVAREKIKSMEYDDRCEKIKALRSTGLKLLETLDYVDKNKDEILEKMLSLSRNTMDKAKRAFLRSVEDAERETFEEVKHNNDKRNKEASSKIHQRISNLISSKNFGGWFEEFSNELKEIESNRPPVQYDVLVNHQLRIYLELLTTADAYLSEKGKLRNLEGINVDLFAMNRFALPSPDAKTHSNCIPLPLHTFANKEKLKGWIPYSYVIAEKLGMGYLEFEYDYTYPAVMYDTKNNTVLRYIVKGYFNLFVPNGETNRIWMFMVVFESDISTPTLENTTLGGTQPLSNGANTTIGQRIPRDIASFDSKFKSNYRASVGSQDMQLIQMYMTWKTPSKIIALWKIDSQTRAKTKSIIDTETGAKQEYFNDPKGKVANEDVNDGEKNKGDITRDVTMKEIKRRISEKQKNIVERSIFSDPTLNPLALLFSTAMKELESTHVLFYNVALLLGCDAFEVTKFFKKQQDVVNKIHLWYADTCTVDDYLEYLSLLDLDIWIEHTYKPMLKYIRDNSNPKQSRIYEEVQKQMDHLYLFETSFREQVKTKPRRKHQDKTKQLEQTNALLMEQNEALREQMNRIEILLTQKA